MRALLPTYHGLPQSNSHERPLDDFPPVFHMAPTYAFQTGHSAPTLGGRGLLLLVVLAAVVAGAGCNEKLSSVAGPTPNLEPTFSSIQREIFERADSSGCVNCHKATGVNFGLDLSHDHAYDQCVNVRSAASGAIRIAPGDPDNSYLIRKLEGKTKWPNLKGNQMPLRAMPLTDGQILIIRRWIALGAPRN